MSKGVTRHTARWLVEKRDGRREPLRAVKLARSIYLALGSVGEPDHGRAWSLARAVLARLHERPRSIWAADVIAAQVRETLCASGLTRVAHCHERMSDDRRRRTAAIHAALTA